jgi:hypothetical protein
MYVTMRGFTSKNLTGARRDGLFRAYLRFLAGCGLPSWDVEVNVVSDGLKDATEIASTAPDGHRHAEVVRSRSAEDMEQNLSWVLLDQYDEWKSRGTASPRG